MRAGVIILILLVLIGAAMFAAHVFWRESTTEAKYNPTPAFTVEEQLFIQKAYDLIQSTMTLNQIAMDKGSIKSAKDLPAKIGMRSGKGSLP